jgi:hypothetical protein
VRQEERGDKIQLRSEEREGISGGGVRKGETKYTEAGRKREMGGKEGRRDTGKVGKKRGE